MAKIFNMSDYGDYGRHGGGGHHRGGGGRRRGYVGGGSYYPSYDNYQEPYYYAVDCYRYPGHPDCIGAGGYARVNPSCSNETAKHEYYLKLMARSNLFSPERVNAELKANEWAKKLDACAARAAKINAAAAKKRADAAAAKLKKDLAAALRAAKKVVLSPFADANEDKTASRAARTDAMLKAQLVVIRRQMQAGILSTAAANAAARKAAPSWYGRWIEVATSASADPTVAKTIKDSSVLSKAYFAKASGLSLADAKIRKALLAPLVRIQDRQAYEKMQSSTVYKLSTQQKAQLVLLRHAMLMKKISAALAAQKAKQIAPQAADTWQAVAVIASTEPAVAAVPEVAAIQTATVSAEYVDPGNVQSSTFSPSGSSDVQAAYDSGSASDTSAGAATGVADQAQDQSQDAPITLPEQVEADAAGAETGGGGHGIVFYGGLALAIAGAWYLLSPRASNITIVK